MLAKLTRGNQITIPKAMVKKAKLKEGNDYLDVVYIKGVIVLKPVDVVERISVKVIAEKKNSKPVPKPTRNK